jgi:hypothetical protein
MNYFSNPNAQHFFLWVWKKKDNLEQVVFYFLSKRNSTSGRFFPLFEYSKNTRIIFLRGLSLPYTDWLMLKIYDLLLFLVRSKLGKYRIFHNLRKPTITKSLIQIIHIDDPTYNEKEIEILKKWESEMHSKNKIPILICTNQYTEKWFASKLLYSKVIIIEQGYIEFDAPIENYKMKSRFSCVYSSPYISVDSDKHAGHETWDASLLLYDLIPRITQADPEIEIHLIGRMGPKAKTKVEDFKNVKCHGLVDFNRNAMILSNSTIALYPRDKNLQRSLSKIMNCIGAGLPIVCFELQDTEIIKINELGIVVKSIDEFVEGIITLKNDIVKREFIKTNVLQFKKNFNWIYLSSKMENYLFNLPNYTVD